MFDTAIAWIEANADLLGGIGTISAATMFLVTNGRTMVRKVATGKAAGASEGPITLVDAPPPSPEYGDRTAIAVLPFKELGALPDHFADGLMDDLIADVQKLGYATPTPAAIKRLQDTGADTHKIARDLGVSYSLEGSVRAQDDRYRVTVQLVSGTGAIEWSDRINVAGDDIMAMQDAIAGKVADGIKEHFSEKTEASFSSAMGATGFRTQSEALAAGTSPKSRLIALILCFLVGVFGVHRFYIGRWFTGILYLFTAGLFAIGWLIDTILLLFGALTDKHNRRIRRWLPADPAPAPAKKAE